jgi:hypothetical protein
VVDNTTPGYGTVFHANPHLFSSGPVKIIEKTSGQTWGGILSHDGENGSAYSG